MLHLCVSGPVYVLDDVEVVLTNREVHFTFTTCIYFCSRNLLRIMVKIIFQRHGDIRHLETLRIPW